MTETEVLNEDAILDEQETMSYLKIRTQRTLYSLRRNHGLLALQVGGAIATGSGS